MQYNQLSPVDFFKPFNYLGLKFLIIGLYSTETVDKFQEFEIKGAGN